MNAKTAFALGFLTYGLIEFATCVYVVRYRPEKLYGIRTRVDGFFQKFAKPAPAQCCGETFRSPGTWRGANYAFAHFTRREDAKLAARGEDVMGSDGKVEELVVYESFREYADEKTRTVRERALDKLTQEEREALGI